MVRVIFEPLAKRASAVDRELLLKGLGLLGNVIVNGLVYLILNGLLHY
jgi:hypothetical protein